MTIKEEVKEEVQSLPSNIGTLNYRFNDYHSFHIILYAQLENLRQNL